MERELLGVLDIGKTHAKLLLVDGPTGETVSCLERPCASIMRSSMRELDVAGIEQWLVTGLAESPYKAQVIALVPVAHGAAAALLSPSDRIITVPDYEDPLFESVRDAYRQVRDPFSDSLSPFLPFGLNLGRQLYFLQHRRPDLFGAATTLLLYPQYWAWRLSGMMASEVTSLGCHSDLWWPRQSHVSQMAVSFGWEALLPALRGADEVLGSISPQLARNTGLDPRCKVLCGIHDSNASYLCHLTGRALQEPFSVISSGTWTVVMAHAADLARLHEEFDMLAGVSALGSPVATARFMGGREYAAIAGPDCHSVRADPAAVASVIAKGAYALPSFSSARGPFARHSASLVGADKLDGAERCALASLYCALMSDLLLDLLGSSGEVIIDGPLASNPVYGPLLAALRPRSAVCLADHRAGPAQCARNLLGYAASDALLRSDPLEAGGLASYRSRWRSQIPLG